MKKLNKRGKAVLGKKPNGLLFWSFRKRVGKDMKTWTYAVLDFTGVRFASQVRAEVIHVTV